MSDSQLDSGRVHSFSVYIVESPSPQELYSNTFEGGALRDALRLTGVPATHRLAVDRVTLQRALTTGWEEMIASDREHVPFLHISAHGSPHGIDLTDGDSIPWSTLAEWLKPINDQVVGMLFLCLSACDGFAWVFERQNRLPFEYLVACAGKPTWAETTVGFLTFYHRFRNGSGIADAVAAMRVASGFDEFELHHSDNPWPPESGPS